MENSKLVPFILIIPFMIFSYTDFVRDTPLQLQGIVTDAQSGKPVQKAHVYVIKGTEEILSNQNGEFRLSTWQKLPLNIIVEHANYKTETISINEKVSNLTVRIHKQ